MTRVISAVVAPGSLSGSPQPDLLVPADLRLRPWRPDDAPAVMDADTTPDIQRWHARSCRSLSEARAWLTEMADGWRAERCATWAITRHATDAVLGRVAIYPDLVAGHGEISYWVLPAARGAGVASRAAIAATRWAHDVGLHRVELEHSTRNEGSRRVALAAGFTEEGVRRQSARHADGWHDMRACSHLATDRPPLDAPER